jgi:hypothetical protein
VASIGTAEALCWAVDLGCTPLSQAPATSYERDDGCDAREGGTDAFGRVQWVS